MHHIKFLSLVFVVALGLNLVWEYAHAALYNNWTWGFECGLDCLRSTFFDATIIIIAFLLVGFITKEYAWAHVKKSLPWVLFIASVTLTATILEWHALATGRWFYDPGMPRVPGLGVGLTPFLQLAVTGVASIVIVKRFIQKTHADTVE